MSVDKEKVERLKYWIVGMINGINVKDLVVMIKNNDVPIPFDAEMMLPDYFDWVKDAVIEHKEKILESITYESAMKYSGEFRPDMKQILQHPRGREWLERFMKVLRFWIENIELTSRELKLKFLRKAQAVKKNREAIRIADEAKEQSIMREELARKEEMAQIAEQKKVLSFEQNQKAILDTMAEENGVSTDNTELITEKRERKPLYDGSPYDIY